MAKEVVSLSVDKSEIPGVLESCIILNSSKERAYVDEFEIPYDFEVFTSTRKKEKLPDVIEIKGLKQLNEVIDKDDCLPDVGLLDYRDDELNLDLKDVTLRQLYKEVLKKVLN